MNRIIVMAKSEVGVIADMTEPLAQAGVNILTLNTDSAGETDIVIIATDDNDAALQALTAAGFRAIVDDTLIIRLRDEPGALAKVAKKFKDAGINIQSLHIFDRHAGYAMVGVSPADRGLAEKIVGKDAVV